MVEIASLQSNVLGLSRDELEALAQASGEARYRGRQLYRAIYARRITDFSWLTDLGEPFRELLAARHSILYPEINRKFESRDGSVRYLLRLEDGESVEAVYMPTEGPFEGPPVGPLGGRKLARATLCISSQVGCAVDCLFCFTGLLGVMRNLTAGEIVGQVLALVRDRIVAAMSPPSQSQAVVAVPPRLNVVFMGMGEPLLNFGPVMKAVRILADPEGVGIPWRRITLSTSGITPRIFDLAREPVRSKLAVSLNASSEEQRTSLMPLNRKYPLGQLLAACRAYPLRPRERLTFEYVLLEGLNDSDADAERVAALLRGLRAKVNLIPFNAGSELPYRPPPLARVLAFQEVLARRRIPAFIRISRGQDIMAACGQLRLAEAGA